jgi:nuclear pore complex protein Nup85
MMDSVSGEDDDDDEVDVCYLEPGAYPRGGKQKWKESGRTMGVAVSPVGGEVVGWIGKKVNAPVTS